MHDTEMKLLQAGHSLILPLVFLLLSSPAALAANDCQPSRWDNLARRDAPSGVLSVLEARDGPSIGANSSDFTTGSINCRFPGRTYDDVNYYTCSQLAETYHITNELFFLLNPTLHNNCSNIQPNTKYCVAGCKPFYPF
jgi:hypothetical protein